MSSTSVSGTNVHAEWAQWPLHFDLGVDVLASPDEMSSLPHDWDPHGLEQRDHGGASWPPADPAQLEMLAVTLDVPGF